MRFNHSRINRRVQTVAAPSSDGFPHTPSKSVVLAHATQILHIRPCVAFSHVVSLFRYTKESSSSAKSRKRLSLPLSGRIALKRTTSAAGDEASEEARYTIRSAYLLLEFTSVCFSSIKFVLTKYFFQTADSLYLDGNSGWPRRT